MWKFALPVAFLALFWVAGPTRSQDTKTTEKAQPVTLIGDYRIESVEISGEKQPEQRIEGTLVHITEDQILVEDRDHKSTPYIATYEVDTNKKPLAISMNVQTGPLKGNAIKGLIEKDGDQLRLIYALPGGQTPTNFTTKDGQKLLVMKVVPK